MAGHEWEDWFEREELIGQISDIRVQNLQVEREVVQKRTFTRWMNLHLEKCNPPLEVHDLFHDIKDGRILMALLEELSGCSLLQAFKPSSHRIFRLNNIAKVLAFLEERNVKLVSIDAADVADGNSSIVLGLIWNIILFFQIKELTGNIRNQFSSSSSLSSIPTSSDSDTSHSSTPSEERRPSIAARDHGKAIKTLLQWVQRRTRKYGVAVQDFGKSWTSGLAFLAVIKSIDPSLVDMRRALLRSSRENIEEAFRTAHYSLGIPRLLEPEDVTLDPPDEQSIMTYISQFLEHFPGIEEKDESSGFRERSKVSARMSDPPVKNGVQRKREKSYVVKKDWVQPPPKIFISSVTEERAQSHFPAQPQTAEDRPWASDESSVDLSSSAADSRPQCAPLGLNKDPASTSISPQPSQIDSAMNSPDSWGEMPSEMAPQLQQSCSDGSLSDLRFSTYPGELNSDQGSPLVPESVSQDHADGDLFIDEGNFSLSSMESLQAKSALLSEEEDAYRYILDLKEDGSASHDLSEAVGQQETETSPVQSPESMKPAPQNPLNGDTDSGYYPGHKDTSITEADEVTEVSGMESQSEHCKESLESSITEDLQKVPSELNLLAFLEDDPECPVVKYERISISGSEEDVETEMPEETPRYQESEEHELPDVFISEDNKTCPEEHSYLRKAEETDRVFHLHHNHQEPAVEPEEDQSEPEDKADLVCTGTYTLRSLSGAKAEVQGEEMKASGGEDSGMWEEPEMKDLREINSEASSSLAEMNFGEVAKVEEEKSCTLEVGFPNQWCEGGEVRENMAWNEGSALDDMSSPREPIVPEIKLEDEISEPRSSHFEDEPGEASRMHEDAAINEKSKLEDLPSEAEQEALLSCSLNDVKYHQSEMERIKDAETYDKLQGTGFEDPELESCEQTSEIALASNINEALKEPSSGTAVCEGSEHPFSPPTPCSHASQPDWVQNVAEKFCDGQSQGQSTWEENNMGTSERVERFPMELRLSLSVTPLQPAPSQSSHADCNTQRSILEKAGEGSVESPEQSPFELWSRHPGEWGAVDSDLHTDHCELISSDEELPAPAPAAAASSTTGRGNAETLGKEAASDAAEDGAQPSSDLGLEEAFDSEESKQEGSEEPADSITAKITNERRPSAPSGGPESSCEVTLTEVYLLLLMWLLVYCLFILPQIDVWTLPSLLLNLEE